MEGAIELAEEIFHMPVRLASPHGVRGMADILNSPIYATGIGLLQYAQHDHVGGSVETVNQDVASAPRIGVLEKMKAWFKSNY